MRAVGIDRVDESVARERNARPLGRPGDVAQGVELPEEAAADHLHVGLSVCVQDVEAAELRRRVGVDVVAVPAGLAFLLPVLQERGRVRDPPAIARPPYL